MSKRQKRLQKIRKNPRNVTFEDLKALLEDYGFELRSKGGTSHRFFVAILGEKSWRLTVPYRRPHINVTYVREALDAIDEIVALKDAEDEED